MSVATPPPTRLTAADLQAMPDEGAGYELVDGELREKNISQESGHIGGEIRSLLREFVYPRKLGVLFPNDVSFKMLIDGIEMVKRPDVGFVRKGRLSRDEYLAKGFCQVVPDLVVEVVSPDDRHWEVQEKRKEWLKARVEIVWIVDPSDETIRVYRKNGPVQLFNSIDTIDAEPIIPGFKGSVAAFFVEPPL